MFLHDVCMLSTLGTGGGGSSDDYLQFLMILFVIYLRYLHGVGILILHRTPPRTSDPGGGSFYRKAAKMLTRMPRVSDFRF